MGEWSGVARDPATTVAHEVALHEHNTRRRDERWRGESKREQDILRNLAVAPMFAVTEAVRLGGCWRRG